MKKKLGKVAFTYADDYDKGKRYHLFDFVTSDIGSHVSLKEDNTGHALSDREWWAPLADVSAAKEAVTAAMAAADKAGVATGRAEQAVADANDAIGRMDASIQDVTTVTGKAQEAAAAAQEAAAEAVHATNAAKDAAAEAVAAKDDAVKATEAANEGAAKAVAEAGKAASAAQEAATAAQEAAAEAVHATNAAKDANAAAGRVEASIQNAAEAAKEAAVAAKEANDATGKAETAAIEAATATTEANEATTAAEEAAGKADKAAQDANTAAANANGFMGYVTEYNVSRHHPEGGAGGTGKFTLAEAIGLIPEALKAVGLKCSFLSSAPANGGLPFETWVFQGEDVSQIGDAGRWVISSASSEEEMNSIESRLSFLEASFKAFNPQSLGYATAMQIEQKEPPTICGCPVCVIADGAPDTTPDFIGQWYIDKKGKKVYIATDVANASGYKVLN